MTIVVSRLTSRMAFTKAKVQRHGGVLPLAVSVDKGNVSEPAAELLLINTSVTTLLDKASGVTTPTVGAIAWGTITIVAALAAVITPVPAMMIAISLQGVGNCPLRPVKGPPLPPISSPSNHGSKLRA